MSVVRINAITVPEGGGKELEARFRNRLGAVDASEGFLGFELLRPTGPSEDRWFVVTRWESDEAFQAWTRSDGFRHGHAKSAEGSPVGTKSELLEFDVVLSELK
jgi:heme-degrading monooxygenase HmoA